MCTGKKAKGGDESRRVRGSEKMEGSEVSFLLKYRKKTSKKLSNLIKIITHSKTVIFDFFREIAARRARRPISLTSYAKVCRIAAEDEEKRGFGAVGARLGETLREIE